MSVYTRLGFYSQVDYLASEIWNSIEQRVLHKAKHLCQACLDVPATTVHVIQYRLHVLAGKNDAYLIPLCQHCKTDISTIGRAHKPLGLAATNQRLLQTLQARNPQRAMEIKQLLNPKKTKPLPAHKKQTPKKLHKQNTL